MHWNINRITVEFKTRYNEETDEVEYNINRITVEFKNIKTILEDAHNRDINRITVEFKRGEQKERIAVSNILIESQWNLKTSCRCLASALPLILIESQWNLKLGKPL